MPMVSWGISEDVCCVSVNLPDGRTIDVFDTGVVQVYDARRENGYEVKLPHYSELPVGQVNLFRL